MSLRVEIKDEDSDYAARVTKFGQLVTAPLQYSTPVAKSLNAINTPFNFIEPQPGQSIIITDILVSADKNVSNTTPCDVNVFESDGIDSSNVIQTLIRPQLLRGDYQNVTGLNLIVPPGFWVNATTDDDVILLTIMYYYAPAPRSI